MYSDKSRKCCTVLNEQIKFFNPIQQHSETISSLGDIVLCDTKPLGPNRQLTQIFLACPLSIKYIIGLPLFSSTAINPPKSTKVRQLNRWPCKNDKWTSP